MLSECFAQSDAKFDSSKYAVYMQTQRANLGNNYRANAKSGSLTSAKVYKPQKVISSSQLRYENQANTDSNYQDGPEGQDVNGSYLPANFSINLHRQTRVSSTSNFHAGQPRAAPGNSNLLQNCSQSPIKQRVSTVNSHNRIMRGRVGTVALFNKVQALKQHQSSNLYTAGTTQDQSSRPQTSGTQGAATYACSNGEPVGFSSYDAATRDLKQLYPSQQDTDQNLPEVNRHPVTVNAQSVRNSEVPSQRLRSMTRQQNREFHLTSSSRPITLRRLNSPETVATPSYDNIHQRSVTNPAKSNSQLERARQQIKKESMEVYSSTSGAPLNVSSVKIIQNGVEPTTRVQSTLAKGTSELTDMVHSMGQNADGEDDVSEVARLNGQYRALMLEPDISSSISKYSNKRRRI